MQFATTLTTLTTQPRLVKERIDRKNWQVSIGITVNQSPCTADPIFFMQHCPDIIKTLSSEDSERLKYLNWLSGEYRKRREASQEITQA